MLTLVAHTAEEWSEACSNAFVSLATRVPATFGGSIEMIDMAELRLARVICRRSSVDRTPARLRSDPRDDVLLNIQLAGRALGLQANRAAEATPGTAMLCEANRPYALRFPESSTLINMRVPRNRVPLPQRRLSEMTARPLPSTTGTMVLRHYLSGLLTTCIHAPPDQSQAASLASTAIDLLAVALHPPNTAAAPGLRGHALHVAAATYLRLHHADPTLSVNVVARHLGVSRRTLELAFAERNDAPAKHLRGVRLAEAARLLSNPACHDTVTTIGRRVGFVDTTTFIRAFRRLHSTTPDAWRRTELRPHMRHD